MKLTVTPIGGVGRSAAAVARAVVGYLQGREGDPAGVVRASGMVAYLADSPEGAGKWLGVGAAWHQLSGVVDREAFQRVLEGRHPVTGARLITAQGSSQRRHLAVGSAARFDESGQPLYSVADAAVLLGVTQREVNEMIAAGASTTIDSDDSARLAVVSAGDGVFVPDSEITRVLEARARPVTAEVVLAGGPANELLSVAEVAALMRVTPQYVRRLCQRGLGSGSDERQVGLPAVVRRRRGRITYRVRRGDVAAFAARRQPPPARVGFDCTLTVEKSVSVLTLLATGGRQQRIVRALDVANRTAIDHLDEVASVARRRGHVVHSEGLTVASFVHGTSRDLDPHYHHHNVVANTVVDDEGAVRALDARALYRHAPEAAALATAALRWELRDLGLGWWQRDNGVWEIAGCPEAVITEFSQRRQDIAEIRTAVAAELGRPITDGEDQAIWAATRADKTAVDPGELVAGWRRRAEGLGFDVDACFDRTDRAIAYHRLPEPLATVLLDDLADPEHGLCAARCDFGHGDVVRAIADWAIDADDQHVKVLLPPGEIVRLADRFCADERVVPIDPACRGGTIRRRDGVTIDDGQGELRYITAELLAVQVAALEAWESGRGGGCGVATAAALDAALAANPQMTGEQAELVSRWCTSGDRVQAAVGRAGTGKTTAMRAAARAWTASGFRVIGAAVKGEAARQLAGDAGIDADTVALLLHHAARGDPVVDADTVLIVDEASTVGDRDLLRLIRLTERSGATLRLIGDPAQHGAVPAGACFHHLAGQPGIAELKTVLRLQDPGERHRAELVRAGRAEAAIAELQAAGQLELRPSEAETYAAVLARWHLARRNGERHPIVHGRNRQRRELNTLAQALLIDDGDVDPHHAVLRSNGRKLCVGDEVIARHGDRRIHPPGDPQAWLRNGTVGRIVAVEHGDLADNDVVHLEIAGGVLCCPRTVFDRRGGGLELAYAVTSYAVQGSTRAVSTSVATAATTRRELYVDITRGRRENKVYGTALAPPGESDEHLPTLPRLLVEDLAVGLRKQTPPAVAIADPAAPGVVAARRGRTLAQLLAAARRGEPGLYAVIERVANTIRQHGQHHPPTALRGVVGELPASPHLRHRYRRLAGDLAVLHASVNAPRRRPHNPLEEALGVRPADQGGAIEWDRLAAEACTLAADIALAAIGLHGEQSPWLVEYLQRCAGDGRLTTIPRAELAATVEEIRNWRNTHHVTDDDRRPLGPRPANPDEQARHDQLTELLDGTTQRSEPRVLAER